GPPVRYKPPTEQEAATTGRLRERFRPGQSGLAAAAGPDGPLAAGSYQLADGVAEITGVGVLPASRRRGLGGAVTHVLAADALARGARTVFLSATDAAVARGYSRLGFRESGTALIARTADSQPPPGRPRPGTGIRRLGRAAADAGQGHRGQAGQGSAFAGEVGLVGVARSRGGGREVERLGRGVEHADEALEAQHALQRLGAVA